MIYVYAISAAMPLPGDIRGIGDAPLETVVVDGLQAVYSSHCELDVTPEPDVLWAHEMVVDGLLSESAVLPLRFGTTFADTGALRALVERECVRFRLLLERVRGRVELAVRVGIPAEYLDPQDGSTYLSAKLAARQATRDAADQVLRPLAELAAATTPIDPVTEPEVKAGYLVRKEELEHFTAEVRRLQKTHPNLSVSCTGPWAPYSFVGESTA